MFAHQDVYLPKLVGPASLASAIDFLGQDRPEPGADTGRLRRAGQRSSACWLVYGHPAWGRCFAPVARDAPRLVVSSGRAGSLWCGARARRPFRLAHLPNFHLYGTDIVLTARSLGRTAYAAHLPVIHNSRPACPGPRIHVHPTAICNGSGGARLPVPTAVIALTETGIALLVYAAPSTNSEMYRPL